MQSGSMKWWVLTAAALCGFFGALPAPAEALPQSASSSSQAQADPSAPQPARSGCSTNPEEHEAPRQAQPYRQPSSEEDYRR